MPEVTVDVGDEAGEDDREAKLKAEHDARTLIEAAEILEDAPRHRRALKAVRAQASAVDKAAELGEREVNRG